MRLLLTLTLATTLVWHSTSVLDDGVPVIKDDDQLNRELTGRCTPLPPTPCARTRRTPLGDRAAVTHRHVQIHPAWPGWSSHDCD